MLSIADCCLGLMLIKFSSVAVAIIARMPPTTERDLHRQPVRDVEQRHVAGERQQNAEAIDRQRVLATAESRRASPASSALANCEARTMPPKPLGPKNAAIAMDRDLIYPIG